LSLSTFMLSLETQIHSIERLRASLKTQIPFGIERGWTGFPPQSPPISK
jgi:hypothetical protein